MGAWPRRSRGGGKSGLAGVCHRRHRSVCEGALHVRAGARAAEPSMGEGAPSAAHGEGCGAAAPTRRHTREGGPLFCGAEKPLLRRG